MKGKSLRMELRAYVENKKCRVMILDYELGSLPYLILCILRYLSWYQKGFQTEQSMNDTVANSSKPGPLQYNPQQY